MMKVTTFYKFISIDSDRVRQLADEIHGEATKLDILGLILLGPEGCNATVSGNIDSIERFKEFLCSVPEFCDLQFKDSIAEKSPFRRFKIDLRPEIVTIKDADIDAESYSSNHLNPHEWQAELKSAEKKVIIDTRNFYETELGMFKGAVDLRLNKFSEFSSAVEKLGIEPSTKVLMYCTGGIRCEKAMVSMKNAGFEKVFQLKGGILKYLEEIKEPLFEGECFVFDHRVAVDKDLKPSKKYRLCPHCGNPASSEIACLNCGKQCKVCGTCSSRENKNSCSKNCAHHLALKKERRAEKPLNQF